MLKRIILFLIEAYQLVLSPDQGILRRRRPVCRFYPTCSEYTSQSIKKYGLAAGAMRGVKRILRCHPWRLGGYDPVK